jgi:hypothetical protein
LHTLDFEGIRDMGYRNVLEAIEGRIPGGYFDGERFMISGRSSIQNKQGPLFLLNGIPVKEDAILTLPVTEIDFVDVLRGGSLQATIYGPAGSHGVVAIYTRSASDFLNIKDKVERKCVLKFSHPGYSKSRKFYEPVYQSEESAKEAFEVGSTVYWNPTLKFGEAGTLKISFSTANLPAVYKVSLEGITSDGIPLQAETFIDIK